MVSGWFTVKEYGQDRFPRGGEENQWGWGIKQEWVVLRGGTYLFQGGISMVMLCVVSCIWLWSQHGAY